MSVHCSEHATASPEAPAVHRALRLTRSHDSDNSTQLRLLPREEGHTVATLEEECLAQPPSPYTQCGSLLWLLLGQGRGMPELPLVLFLMGPKLFKLTSPVRGALSH